MGQLTTHVLDTSAGLPAAGIRIELHELTATGATLLAGVDHRPGWTLRGAVARGQRTFAVGRYALTFYVAEYFRGARVVLAGTAVSRGCGGPHRHCAARPSTTTCRC